MNLQLAFLLTFLAGGISVWILIRMSRQAEQDRMDVINKQISTIGGNTISIDLVARKNCPFSSEYGDPDLVYKFYKITYDVEHELKECWAVLEMKQRSYGPSGAIKANWIWRY
ncbi:MAG: hypothetical protein ACJAT7_000662 [Psychromonas sp.]|jgi:hypothetical protein|uniref:hypothetical protein n=1 Tax=Psychromonas sp. TaxID=1884585 RepID=UPI0039E4191F